MLLLFGKKKKTNGREKERVDIFGRERGFQFFEMHNPDEDKPIYTIYDKSKDFGITPNRITYNSSVSNQSISYVTNFKEQAKCI